MFFNYDGSNKLTRNQPSAYETASNFQYLKYGEVVTNIDEEGLGRIKVRIKGPQSAGGDDGINDADLPFAISILPKHLQIIPKIGEATFIFVFDKMRQQADRMYIGPITSQLDKLNKDSARTTALRGFTFGPLQPNVNLASIPELNGIFPSEEEVSIQGRYNTDITQKNNEIVIRAGKFEVSPVTSNNPYPFRFNSKTQSYIQLKNDIKVSVDESGNVKKGSITNIVANKINLITHENGSPRFNVTNQNNLISDDEMARILNEAHQVPFGDVLLEYLKLLKDALFFHVHNGNGNQATDLTASGNKQALALFKSRADDLEKAMLSTNIRIN